jgi:hypothetical protein
LTTGKDVINGDGHSGSKYSFYKASGTDDEYILAVKNTGEANHLTFTLNGWIVKKVAVSVDRKAVNAKGWTTESRNRVIDPALTSFMTGKDVRTYIATNVDFDNKKVTLMRIDADSEQESFKGYLMTTAVDGDNNACIIRNVAATGENPKLNILDNGYFHLFVPDMHDEAGKDGGRKLWTSESKLSNNLVAQLSPTTPEAKIPAINTSSKYNGYTNYAFTCNYYDVDPETGAIINNSQVAKEGIQAFYRIVESGANSAGNQGYLPINVPAEGRSAVRAKAAASPLRMSVEILNRSSVLFDKGDVNGDGMLSRQDVESMSGHVMGRQSPSFIKGLADLNGDGQINIVDLTLLIDKVAMK